MHENFCVKIHTTMFAIDATFNSILYFICNVHFIPQGDTLLMLTTIDLFWFFSKFLRKILLDEP